MFNDFQKRLLEADSEYIASDYSGLSLYDISQKYNYEDISLEEAEKIIPELRTVLGRFLRLYPIYD